MKGFSAARTAVCPSAVNVGTSQPCSVNGGSLIAVTAATPGAASSDQDSLIRGTAACRGASAYSDGSESVDEHQPIVGHPGVHLLQPDTPTRAPGRRGDDHHAASAHLRLHRPATPYVPYCTYYLLYLSGAEYSTAVDRGCESIAFQIVASWPRFSRTAVLYSGRRSYTRSMPDYDQLVRWLLASQKRPDADGRIVLSVADAICSRRLAGNSHSGLSPVRLRKPNA